MISQFVRVQLVVFALVSIVSILLISVVYARIPALLGFGQHSVSVRLVDAAGLYDGARVTFQGISVGQVTGIAADADSVKVTMSIEDSYRIPDDVLVHVRSVSAIGEQYVDLTSDRAEGPFMEAGGVIPVDRTTIPTTVDDLLANANSLLTSLPPEKLATTLRELRDGFQDTGPQLGELLDQSMTLLDAADADLPATETLLADLEPVLRTQRSSSAELRSIVDRLASFTDRVRDSDDDLRAVLDHAPAAVAQVSSLFQELRPTLPLLLSNLIEVEEVLLTYNPAIEQVLVVYPMFTAGMVSALQPHTDDRAMKLALRLSVNPAPPCSVGFLPPEKRRPPEDRTEAPTPPGLYCKLPQDHSLAVRGARNFPCLEVPGKRAPSPEQCRGEQYRPKYTDSPAFPPDSPIGALSGAVYDPESGQALSADGSLFTIGAIGTRTPGEENLTWQRMLSAPVGR